MDTDRQRLDKWLWHARVVKTRSLAAALVVAGRVRVDGERVTKPARPVTVGEVLTIVLDHGIRILEVAGFTDRRGSAAVSAGTYVDRSPAREAPRTSDGSPVAGPRPDRRQRRAGAAIRGKPLN
ncbi:MAG: RNA-binding S4 domain-containing protein [Flavobacteriaceae bacterium]